MTTIRSLRSWPLRVPLARPWAPDVRHVGVVATHVVRADGVEGWGFSWTPQIGAEAVLALLRHDIAPFAIGLPADVGTPDTPSPTWDRLWRHLHEAGAGGLTTIALAGLDLALWDAQARQAACSVSELLGRRRARARVYGSGVNLHYPLEELLAQAARWVHAGFEAVKIKVGKPDLAEDLDRVAAVREVIGPDRALMLDANQRWDLDRARRAIDRLSVHRPAWIEEPLRADELRAYAALALDSPVPLAGGENIHTRERFAEFLEAGAMQVAQPNVIRVGGITPFLRIARLAEEHGVAVHPHLLPELSGPLALCLPGDPLVEDVDGARFADQGVLRDPSPVRIVAGRLEAAPHIGLGMRFGSAPPSADEGLAG